MSEKAKDAAQKTSEAVKDAGTSAADKMKDLWRRIDAGRLENRTRDELVAYLRDAEIVARQRELDRGPAGCCRIVNVSEVGIYVWVKWI